MQDQTSRPAGAKPGILSRVAVVLYLICIGLAVAMPVMLTLLPHLVLRTEAQYPRGLWRATMVMHWLQALTPVVTWLGWMLLLLIGAANCIFVAWLYLAYRELARMGARTRYGTHWAITGFLIPFLNLVRPYQVVRDAWRAATGMRQQGKEGVAPTPLRIKVWWTLTLILSPINYVGAETMAHAFRELTPMAMAVYIGSAVVPAFSVMLIALIEGELGRCRSGGPARVTLFGRWPLPAVASVSVVLVAASITLGVYGYANRIVRVTPPPLVAAPEEAPAIHEQANPSSMSGGVVGGVQGGVTVKQRFGVVGGVVGGVEGKKVPPRAAVQRILVNSTVQKALLVKMIEPVYPDLAKRARVSGTVSMHAIISKDGRVLSLEVLSGSPLLTQAAIQAVSQWVYKPTLLKGEPVEVDTTIDVVFALDQN
jgi:TonB family protein